MAMIIYSAALIISCFFMAWGATLLTRLLMGMLRTDSDRHYSNAVVIAWVGLGFLQVVGMPFAWWVLSIVVSVVCLLAAPRESRATGWVLLFIAALGCAGLALGLGAPDYLITESLIVAAASLAGVVLARTRRGLPAPRAATLPLAMALAYVAYSATLPTIKELLG